MKIELWVIGKTKFDFIREGDKLYEKRIKRYVPFKTEVIPDIKNTKNLTSAQIKEKEGNEILKRLHTNDYLVVLDEKGKSFNSVNFANQLDKTFQRNSRKLIFLIGGSYGFADKIYRRSQEKISLSEMTFSHQIVRLMFLEQFYRGMTILRGEPYHNE